MTQPDPSQQRPTMSPDEMGLLIEALQMTVQEQQHALVQARINHLADMKKWREREAWLVEQAAAAVGGTVPNDPATGAAPVEPTVE